MKRSHALEFAQQLLDMALRLVVVGILYAAAAGAAHAQLTVLRPDGTINPACAATPRVPPLPVPPASAPAQAHMPTQATVTMAAGIPVPVELPAQIGGSGTKALIDFNARGIAIGWWLPQVGSVKLYLYAVTWPHLLANPGLAARLVLLAASPNRDSATVAAIGVAYPPTLHALDMCDVWGPLVAPLNAMRPAPLDPNAPPPQPAYVATSTTLYPLVNGARGAALASPKATLGQACDCSVTVPNPYGGRYCAVTVPNVSAIVVAGCSLKR